jgi:hypothetical protein
MSCLSASTRLSSLRTSLVCLLALLVLRGALPAYADSQARIVRLSDVQGSVQINKNSGVGFENAFLNLPITQGAQIQTRENGRAEIEFEDGSTMRLAPGSKVEFSTLGLGDSGARISVVHLIDGVAYVNWLGKSGDRFTLNFSHEKVELDHAAHFRIDASAEMAKLAVFKGEAQVAGPAGSVTVEKKNVATFDEDDKATLGKDIEKEPLDSWDKEAISYHERYANNNSSPYGYGVSDLNYYGSYTSVPGYGTMWQPYFTDIGWDPFMNGAWSWYPGMGYTFVSAYPWGWMPYRYGSWMFVPGFGWMWQPGYSNGWATVPRYVGATKAGFHGLIAPIGTVSTVVVGKGGPVLSSVLSTALPSHITVSRGSAGMGVPRGALGNLKPWNSQVAKSGSIQVRNEPQFSGSSRSAVGGARGESRSEVYEGSAASAHVGVAGSGHAAGSAHH